jgi:hypothetical protein
VGKWKTEVLNSTTDKLCIQLDVSSEADFVFNVTFSRRNSTALQSTKTENIFTVRDFAGTHFKLKTDWPLDVQSNSTTLFQVVIHTTEDVTFQTPIVQLSDCAPDANSQ